LKHYYSNKALVSAINSCLLFRRKIKIVISL
jgi:hypothetical protein